MTQTSFYSTPAAPPRCRRCASRPSRNPSCAACRRENRMNAGLPLVPAGQDPAGAQALLVAENNLLQMIASGHALSETLEAICKAVERAIAGSFCGFTQLSQTTVRLKHRVQSNSSPVFDTAADRVS